jgi:catalase
VNQPRVPVHSYSKDGAMRVENVTDPVYAPNTYGSPTANPERVPEQSVWAGDVEMVRSAYALRKDDDDFGQARTLVREVLDDDARARLAGNIIGHAGDPSVTDEMKPRIVEYWMNVDEDLGRKVAEGIGVE